MSLIRWYKLDGNAYDSSSSRDNGEASAGVTYDPSYGITCQGGKFDSGRTDYIDFSTINITTHHTICFWMYANVENSIDATGGMIMGTFHNGTNWMYVADNLRFRINDGASQTWTTDKDFYHKWRHVSIVFGTTMELFFDGELQETGKTYSGSFDLNNIGAAYTDTSYDYNGYLCDIRVYDHKLSKKEIKYIAQGKVIHYKFEMDRTTLGDKIIDSSDYGNHATIYAGDTPTWSNTEVKRGPASYRWDTITDHYIRSDNQIYLWAQGNTISCWVKADFNDNDGGENVYIVGPYQHCLIGPGSGPDDRCGIRSQGGGGDDLHSEGDQDMFDNSWHHYCVSCNSTGNSVYKDGVQVGSSNTWVNGPNTGVEYFYVGEAWSLTSGPYRGYISDVRFYQTGLSSDDILNLYQTSILLDNKGNLWC